MEDVTDTDETPKTKEITVEEWIHMNSQPPIWMRYVTMFIAARERHSARTQGSQIGVG